MLESTDSPLPGSLLMWHSFDMLTPFTWLLLLLTLLPLLLLTLPPLLMVLLLLGGEDFEADVGVWGLVVRWRRWWSLSILIILLSSGTKGRSSAIAKKGF